MNAGGVGEVGCCGIVAVYYTDMASPNVKRRKSLQARLRRLLGLVRLERLGRLMRSARLVRLRKVGGKQFRSLRTRLGRLPRRSRPFLILLAAIGLFMWFQVTADAPVPAQVQNRAPLISVQTVARTTASPTLRIFGQVETPNWSSLTAALEADIVAVNVLEGDSVEAGQVLIVLDETDAALEMAERQAELREVSALMKSEDVGLQADMEALEAELMLLELAKKSVARMRALLDSEAGSELAVEQAIEQEQQRRLAVAMRRRAINGFEARRLQLQARFDKAKAALQRAERTQRRTQILAPFAGRVSEVRVAAGERTQRGTALLRLYDESQLELRAQVPSNTVELLRRSIAAELPVTALANDDEVSIPLSLHRLSASVAPGQGGMDAFFRVREGEEVAGLGECSVRDCIERLSVLGKTLEISLQLPPMDNVVVVAADSLYGGGIVYRVREEEGDEEDSVLESVSVQRLGQFVEGDGQRMLILSAADFGDGDAILNSRLPQAVSGLRVRVVQ